MNFRATKYFITISILLSSSIVGASDFSIDPARGSFPPNFLEMVKENLGSGGLGQVDFVVEQLKDREGPDRGVERNFWYRSKWGCPRLAADAEKMRANDEDRDEIAAEWKEVYECAADINDENAQKLPSPPKSYRIEITMKDDDDRDWKSGFLLDVKTKIEFNDRAPISSYLFARFERESSDLNIVKDKITEEKILEGYFSEVPVETHTFKFQVRKVETAVAENANKDVTVNTMASEGRLRANVIQIFLKDGTKLRQEWGGGIITDFIGSVATTAPELNNLVARYSSKQLKYSDAGFIPLIPEPDEAIWRRVKGYRGAFELSDGNGNQLELNYVDGSKVIMNYNQKPVARIRLGKN